MILFDSEWQSSRRGLGDEGRKMKMKVGLVVVMAAVMVAAPAQAAPHRLAAGTAEQIAQQKGRAIVSRSPRLQISSLFACTRLGGRSFSCLVEAHGESKRNRLDCSFTIAIRPQGDRESAHVARRRCRTVRLLFLTRRRAVEALQEGLLRVQGPIVPLAPASLSEVHRISRSEFEGRGAWRSEISPGVVESCSMRLSALLVSRFDVKVEAGGTKCRKHVTVS